MALWEQITNDDGQVYYYNPETEETSWELPEGAEVSNAQANSVDSEKGESKWEEYLTDDGQVYYFNTETQVSSWEKPEGFVGGRVSAVPAENDDQEMAEVAANENEAIEIDGDAMITTVAEEVDDGGQTEDLEVLREKYPDKSEISKIKHMTSITPKQLEEAKGDFVEMLKDHNVDSHWSFTKAMESCIKEPRYWVIPDSLMKRDIFESYLLQKSEEEYKEKLNFKEAYKEDFIKILASHNVKYYSRWKTVSAEIVNESIYALASEKLKKEIFEAYIGELRAEHDREEKQLRAQAIQELEEYVKNDLKLSLESKFDDFIAQIGKDPRFASNKHFKILAQLDLLQTYDSVMKKLEMDAGRALKYHKLRANHRDAIKRQNFVELVNKNLDFKITPKTSWYKFVTTLHTRDEFDQLLTTQSTSSTPVDYFWDKLNESQQFLNAQKNLAISKFVDNGIARDVYNNGSFEKFKECCERANVCLGLHEDELEYIFELISKDENVAPVSKSRDLSPRRDAKVTSGTTTDTQEYRTARGSAAVVGNDLDY